MAVRLVYFVDTMKRKGLMIIYGESFAPTGYGVTQLAEGAAEPSKWAAVADGLLQRAEQNISISRK
ncbi:MAG TPA: hypothetical protein VJN21_01980 [Candidatus Acidoferrales bacterium]|nr:hypothetical protein [Candidatus Acidoferrales bacterium]